MRKSLLKLLGVIAGLALSASVSAVGLGNINVKSALGQPLNAEIDLMAVTSAEKGSLVARLATPDAYKNIGLDYPSGIKFKFQIDTRPNGDQYLKVTSVESINDPFVSLLVDLSWPSGKLLREYTFLLDPVGYVPEQPAPTAVQPVAPEMAAKAPVAPEGASEVLAVPVEQEAAPVTPVAPEQAAAPAPAPGQSAEQQAQPEAQAGVPETATQPAAAPEVIFVPPKENPEWISVKRGDTMYKLAEQYKMADMDLERMLVAMYRVNANQFDGKNMNRIQAGKILKLPTQESYDSVTLAEAKKEIHAQAVDWNAYRQKLASAASVSAEVQPAQQVATGKISSSVADKTPVARESAKEVLKLSKGEAPGDQVGAGGKSAQDRKNAAQEEAIARQKAQQEEKMRTAMLEKNLQDMQRLAQLKAEAAAAQAQPPQPPAAQPQAVQPQAPKVAATTPAAPPAAEAKPKPKETPKSKMVTRTEPSLIDQLLAEPLYMGGAAALLLVIGGAGFVVYKRKKKVAEGIEEAAAEEEDIGSSTGRMVAPVVPSPDTGDFTRAEGAQPAAPLQSDTVDPISEADLFLNFGRDAQAEEILKDALQTNPNNHQIHLKLLGIYANRKDANSFAGIARQLQESGDEAAWQQAADMGRRLEPGNPMYGGSGDEGLTKPQIREPASTPAAAALDFDFDAAAKAASPVAEEVADITMGPGVAMAETGGSTDFDVTSSHPSMPAMDQTTVLPNPDEMVFDVTGGHAAVEEKPADDGSIAFTLDFPTEQPAPKAATAASVELAGISLNFDEPLAGAEPGGSAQFEEVATKLDLAKAYLEMGDQDGARGILDEVLHEGNSEQKQAAQELLAQL